MEIIRCNLCGSHDERELYRSERFRAVICIRCSFAYLNPRMTQAEYTRYYEREYQHNRHALDSYEAAIERLTKKKSYERKKQLLPMIGRLTSRSKVLEIGSGWGTLLKLIKDTWSCEVRGLEISSLAAEVSRAYYGVPTDTETLESFCAMNAGGDMRFDRIIMYHVLEHILDPRQALRDLVPLVAPGGRLFVAVPNLAWPDEDPSRFFRIEHCSYFTQETLARMLRAGGFEPERIITTATDIQAIAVPCTPASRHLRTRRYPVSYIRVVVSLHRLREQVKSRLRPAWHRIHIWLQSERT